MTSKRPRSELLQACYNCGRSGVLPCAMLADDDGNRFCSQECGWSYLLGSRQRTHTRLTPKAPNRSEHDDDLKLMRQQFANADRVQQLMLRRLRRDPRYRAAMRLDKRKTSTNSQASVPVRHSDNTYFTFGELFS